MSISQGINDKLDDLIEVIPKFSISSENTFRTYNHVRLQKIMHEKELSFFHFPSDLIEHSVKLTNNYFVFLNQVKTGNLSDTIIQELEQIDLKAREELPHELSIYTQQHGQSVKALYYHRKLDFNAAFESTIKCIEMNDYLIQKGFLTHILRSVEQNVNITRILYAQNKIEESHQVWKGIFEYLLNGKANNLIGNVFKNYVYWEQIKYIREPFILSWFDIFLYYVLKNAKISIDDENKIIHSVFSELSTNMEINTSDRQAISDWIAFKNNYFNDDIEQYIESYLEFIDYCESKIYDTIKLSLSQSILNYLENKNYPNKALLKNKIEKYIQDNLILPQFLKDVVCQY